MDVESQWIIWRHNNLLNDEGNTKLLLLACCEVIFSDVVESKFIMNQEWRSILLGKIEGHLVAYSHIWVKLSLSKEDKSSWIIWQSHVLEHIFVICPWNSIFILTLSVSGIGITYVAIKCTYIHSFTNVVGNNLAFHHGQDTTKTNQIEWFIING